MMYLVLLALLALNVQVDFIDAFFDISKSIERTVEKIDFEHNQSINSITTAYELDSLSYHESYLNSVEAGIIADRSINIIDSLRDVLLYKTGGYNEYGYPNNSIASRISENVFMQRKGARKLKYILQNSKKGFLKLLPKEETHLLEDIYESSDYVINSRGVRLTWEEYHFNNLALGGSLALLSRFKNDIIAMKSVILNFYLNEIYGELTDLIVTGIEDSLSIEVGVINTESFVVGDEINIKIQLPKFDEINKTNIVLFDSKNGMIKESIVDKSNKVIKFEPKVADSYTVKADVLDANNQTIRSVYKNFDVIDSKKVQHIVIDELIKSKNQSLLFLGIKNIIEIKHPEFTFHDMRLQSNNGKLERKQNRYIVIPERAGSVSLTLYAKGVKLASRNFIVNILPDPKVIINNTSNNSISTKLFQIQSGLSIEINEDYFFNAYQIKGFQLSKLDARGNLVFVGKNNSSFFEGNVLNEIRNAKPSETYIFTDINVKGSDGVSKVVSPIVLKVK